MPTICLRVSRFFAQTPETQALYRLYRGVDVRDVAAAHALAVTNKSIAFDIFNISAHSPFLKDDLSRLLYDATTVLQKRVPYVIETFAQHRKRFFLLNVIETDRLILRHLTTEDAPFILTLMNDPSWLQFIGDNGIRTIKDAYNYIVSGPVAMYVRVGFGLYLTALKEDHTSIGICGLIKRDSFDDVDIGFAFLPQFWSQGYAYESASAVIAYGRQVLGLQRIVAITSQDNKRSAHLLEKLGLHFERLITLTNSAQEVRLFATETMD